MRGPRKSRDAAAWREFWRDRGERELALLLRDEWGALGDASLDEYVGQATRIATLLGSRASVDALEAELGRMRAAVAAPPAPETDRRAAEAVGRWFASA